MQQTLENHRSARHAARQKHPLDHVRPAALRLSRLHRPPDAEDAEHRRTGGARRALLPRLCAVADLRPVAHELLHRALHALARLALERLAAARRRADAGRSPQEDRRAQCAGRQDPHGARSRRHEDARHRAGLDHRRACRRMRLRAVRARRRPASDRAAAPALRRLSARARLRRGEPVGAMGEFRRGDDGRCRTAGCSRMPTRPRACRRSIPRRPT